LRWTEENSVYLPELDEEHQTMFRLLQELRRAVVEGEEAARLKLRAKHLADEITSHFRHEERMMREAQYPQAEWHKRQHATARAQLAAMADSIRSRDQASIFDSLEAVAKGIRDHINIADRMAGAFLRNHMRSLR